MLIGHSIGGLVARLSILMSNHPSLPPSPSSSSSFSSSSSSSSSSLPPSSSSSSSSSFSSCSVHTLLLLSSPVLSPPFPLDASLTQLVNSINKSWLQSHYYTSRACRDSESSSSSYPYSSFSRPITVNWTCNSCAANMTLISITGGEIDELVSTSSSSLLPLGPLPLNQTQLSAAAKKKNFSILSLITSSFLLPYKLFKGLFSLTSSKPATKENTCDALNTTCPAEEETMEASKSIDVKEKKSESSWEDISEEDWSTHMRKFIVPKHIQLRTSQLKKLGFVVDHKALMWCSQLLSEVVGAMEKLTASRSDDLKVDLFKIFGLRKGVNVKSTSTDILPEVQYLLQRNHTASSFPDAMRRDYEYFYSSFRGNYILTMSTVYVTSHWFEILNSYLSISILILAHYFLKGQSTKQASTENSSYPSFFQSLPPKYHFFVITLYSPIAHLFALLFGYNSSKRLYSIALGFIGTSFLFFSYLVYSEKDTGVSILKYSTPFLFPLISYGAALGLRLCLFLLLLLFKRTVVFLFYLLRFVLRSTIWCRPVRQTLKKPFSRISRNYLAPIYKHIKTSLFLYSLSLCLFIASFLNPSKPSFYSLPALLVNAYFVTVYFLTLLVYLYKAIRTTSSSQEMDQILLFWPIFFTTLPPLLSSVSRSFPSSSFNVSFFYSGLHTSLVERQFESYFWECAILLTVVWIHLSRDWQPYERLLFIRPVNLMVAAFGPHHTSELQLLSTQSMQSSSFGPSSTAPCQHEEGGKAALYRRVNGYRYVVLSCDCSKNPSLKGKICLFVGTVLSLFVLKGLSYCIFFCT